MAVFPIYYWHKGIGRYIGFYRQFTTGFLLFLCEKVSFLGVKKLVVNMLCKNKLVAMVFAILSVLYLF
jgi:hypothetical protein